MATADSHHTPKTRKPRRARNADRRPRRISRRRYREGAAEALLYALLERPDILGRDPAGRIWVLLSVLPSTFEEMAAYRTAEDVGEQNSEDEGEEDHDGEASLGSTQEMDQSTWGNADPRDLEGDGNVDQEPSLGSGPAMDQTHWRAGVECHDTARIDMEGGEADREPSLGSSDSIDQTRWVNGWADHDEESDMLELEGVDEDGIDYGDLPGVKSLPSVTPSKIQELIDHGEKYANWVGLSFARQMPPQIRMFSNRINALRDFRGGVIVGRDFTLSGPTALLQHGV